MVGKSGMNSDRETEQDWTGQSDILFSFFSDDMAWAWNVYHQQQHQQNREVKNSLFPRCVLCKTERERAERQRGLWPALLHILLLKLEFPEIESRGFLCKNCTTSHIKHKLMIVLMKARSSFSLPFDVFCSFRLWGLRFVVEGMSKCGWVRV